MTEDLKCFWNEVSFCYGWNKTNDVLGYSVILKKPLSYSKNRFLISTEKILLDLNSLCCKVAYLEKDIITKENRYNIKVSKFFLYKNNHVAKGLVCVPGIAYRINSEFNTKITDWKVF